MFSDRGQRPEIKDQSKAARGAARRSFYCSLLALFCLLSGAACRRDMQDQPRYESYERDVTSTRTSSRAPVEGTVPRGFLREDVQFYTGKSGGNANSSAGGGSANTGASGGAAAGNSNSQSMTGGASTGGGGVATTDANNVVEFPLPVTAELIDRGQERYNIFCSMCHGATGAGDGMIVRRGYRRPPSYHEDRLREERVGHFFDVITNGWGTMPSYANQIPPADRWAIVAYIRALQVSGGATLTAQGTTGGAAQPSSQGTTPEALSSPQQGGQPGEGGTRR